MITTGFRHQSTSQSFVILSLTCSRDFAKAILSHVTLNFLLYSFYILSVPLYGCERY